MKIKRLLFLLVSFIALVASPNSVACLFDFQCQADSLCIKQYDEMFGACFKREIPDLKLERDQSKHFPRIQNTMAKPCSDNVHCGTGYWCEKSFGNLLGVCRKAQLY